jgi:putative hemolysin
VLFDRAPLLVRPTSAEIAQAVLAVVLVVVFCNQILPSLLFNRTSGRWAARLLWPIRLLLWLMTPITVFVRFFFSVASLAEQSASPEEEMEADVEALLEAGEEEGILEESDRDLVRSAVEFGDKLVREVMTPRPEVFAVPETTHPRRVSRTCCASITSPACRSIPARSTTSPASPSSTTCCKSRRGGPHPHRRQHPAPGRLRPETKRGYELLREMQREKQHMRIVIDEYGGVSGLVTIEDLLEQIVGNIRDEHEVETLIEEPQREPGGSWLVPAGFPVDQLEDLVGERRLNWTSLRSHHAGRPGQRDRGPHSASRRGGPARTRRPAPGSRRLDRSPRRAAAGLPAGGGC